jgi:hypothetical protein
MGGKGTTLPRAGHCPLPVFRGTVVPQKTEGFILLQVPSYREFGA